MNENYYGDDQIVGDDLAELIGDDYYGDDEPEEFSGRRRGGGGKRVHGGLRVMQKRKDTLFKQPLPIPATVVGAGATVVISMQPQRTIRVERLAIPRSLVDDFTINSVNVGQEPQFVAEGSLPADIFAPDAVGIGLKGDTANIGNLITMSVTNTSAGSLTFRGAILGTVIN